MPRFLTPARIALLCLIHAYQEGAHTTESALSVLDFISCQIIAPSDQDRDEIQERSAFTSLGITYFSDRLRKWSSKTPGRSVFDALLYRIWMFTSLHSLHELMDEMNEFAVGPPHSVHVGPRSHAVTPTSPIGLFIRRCYVEFTRLQFEDSNSLWRAFCSYRAPTYEEFVTKNPELATRFHEQQATASIPGVQQSQGNDLFAHTKSSAAAVDADMLLHFAIRRLQKEELRVPRDMQAQIERWVGDQLDSSTQSLHYFMAFFDSWRAGQYNMALESLHRYFDYSLVAKAAGDNMKVHYQYALLHLSILHADFECWGESVDAMNECIATARENHDTACLNFALSWLLHLRHASPHQDKSGFGTVSGIVGSGSELDEIAFLKQKAKEGKNWMLLSSTLLEEAKLELYSGESTDRAHEHVLQSMYLNVQHDLRTLVPAGLLFQSACLDRLGHSYIANLNLTTIHHIYAQQCPEGELARASCRRAHAMARNGDFAGALTLLNACDVRANGLLKQHNRILAFATIVQLRRSLHRGNFDVAEHHLTQLRPVISDNDAEIALEVRILEVELLLKQNLFAAALHKVNERLNACKSRETDIAQRLHFLILKARVFVAGGQPAKGFTLALRATATAERQLLVPVLLEGVCVLGKILIELAEFRAARDMLEAALPHAIPLDNALLTGRFFLTLAEAYIGMAGHDCAEGSAERIRTMHRAIQLMERGREYYERVWDLAGMLDCLALKSHVAAWLGDSESAERADEMYMQLLVDARDDSAGTANE